MNNQKNTSISGFVLGVLYAALVLAGFILSVTKGLNEQSVFKPMPYALGNTYDARQVQLAENHQQAIEAPQNIAMR